jgi:hypothetical protein
MSRLTGGELAADGAAVPIADAPGATLRVYLTTSDLT